jgi:hypothetical protein
MLGCEMCGGWIVRVDALAEVILEPSISSDCPPTHFIKATAGCNLQGTRNLDQSPM